MRPTDLASVARFILSGECRSVAILTGAGVSVAAGIPDFRSPGGMYDTLRPELITATPQQKTAMRRDPISVVLREMFFANAFPYLEVRRPFILGTQEHKWKATLSHRFVELLHQRTGKLTRLYTQNIDGLDYQCNLPADKLVPVHGSIGRVACEGCGAPVDFDDFCASVRTQIKDIYNVDGAAPSESSPIPCSQCQRPLVKPTTVLFGSNLPAEFFECAERDMPEVDLLIVAGTSLVVSPANSLIQRARKEAVRLIINNEAVGAELGIEYNPADSSDCRDVFARGECDQVFLELIGHLGFTEDLVAMRDQLPEQSQRHLAEFLAARES